MSNLKDFLKKYNISEEEFKKTGLDWDELLKIKKDFESYKPELGLPANYLLEAFHEVPIIHSVRFRIKESEHLLEKLIRKRTEDPSRIIDIDNYKDEITDLIGLRALHLFKEDWQMIHNFILKTWDLKEDPIAYYRIGDSPEYIDNFRKSGCLVKEHPYGYRSVHYLVNTKPNKNTYTAEVQVRTIFEEGWSEIDHIIRYPYDSGNKLLNQFLVIFNRLAGSADEMGSYVRYLKYDIEKKEKEVQEKVQIIDDLKKKIKELELKPKEERELEEKLNELDKLNLSPSIYAYANAGLSITDLYSRAQVSLSPEEARSLYDINPKNLYLGIADPLHSITDFYSRAQVSLSPREARSLNDINPENLYPGIADPLHSKKIKKESPKGENKKEEE